VAALSYPLGAMKFYPAAISYLQKSKHKSIVEKRVPAIELELDGNIHYHIPLEQPEEFRLSTKPAPQTL